MVQAHCHLKVSLIHKVTFFLSKFTDEVLKPINGFIFDQFNIKALCNYKFFKTQIVFLASAIHPSLQQHNKMQLSNLTYPTEILPLSVCDLCACLSFCKCGISENEYLQLPGFNGFPKSSLELICLTQPACCNKKKKQKGKNFPSIVHLIMRNY